MNKIIEAEELKIELKETQQALYEALNKIDKAIEHCKNNLFVDSQFIYEQLEILGGDSDGM